MKWPALASVDAVHPASAGASRQMSGPLGEIGAVRDKRLVGWMRAAAVRRANWIPAATVMVVVLAVGSRFIAMSMQQHAAQARESAGAIVGRFGDAIESRLQDLARDAQRQSTAQAPSASLQWGAKSFRLAADGKVVDSGGSEAAIEQAVLSEWASADAHSPGAPVPGFLGPILYGSQWLVAVRVPVTAPNASGAARPVGWWVAYQTLDALLSSAGLGRPATTGYDFELTQHVPTRGRSRVLWSSAARRLDGPITRAIELPAALPQSLRGAALTIAVRPRAGWYPASELVADIGLLAVVTWLLTIGAYDVMRKMNRQRAALAAGKRRYHALNQRLMLEIEQRQSLQRSFDHARYHDAFTGLPNRSYFLVQLERALRELRTQQGYRLAIVLVDIDRFKLINDTLGHTAGDEVMIHVARCFEHATAPFEGVLARWGGDQFALLLFDVHSRDTAIAVARMLRESLRAPFTLRKHQVSIAARVGVTCIDAGPRRAEDVLREADIALSTAKSQTDTPVVAYDSAMGGDVLGLVSIEADLHVALEQGQLLLLLQPIVDLRGSHIVGAEALLRWQHPVEGLLAPDRFLAIAEEAGLMVPITRWTIERACRVAGEWRRRLPPETDFWISINVSAAALRDPSLVDHVASVLNETRTPARALKFELTESGLIRNIGAAKEILERLRGMGIQLMLDDFGTGYSSLTHLQVFPFDYVKIDRPLASRSDSQQADHRIMSAMVRMVSSLGLKTIAKIVETEAGAQALQQAGCDFGQGFFFCSPVTSEEALRRLRTQDYWAPRAAAAQADTLCEGPAVRAQALATDATSAQTPPPVDVAEHARLAAAYSSLPALVQSDEPADNSPMLVQSDATAASPVDNSTLQLSVEELALPEDGSPKPVESDATLALSVDGLPTLVLSDERLALAVDGSPTLVQSDATLALPVDGSPTLVQSNATLALPVDGLSTLAQSDATAASPADNSTLQLSVEELALPEDGSPKPVESDATLALAVDGSPTLVQSNATLVLPVDGLSTLVQSDATAASPVDNPTLQLSVEELALPEDGSPTPLQSDATPASPVDNSTLLLSVEELALPEDVSPTPVQADVTPALPVDGLPTPVDSDATLALLVDNSVLLSVEDLALPIDGSPTLAEPVELSAATDSGGDLPDLEKPRRRTRRPSRAGIR
jgi:diguanylate cyclase (GGDEF)-like protein